MSKGDDLTLPPVWEKVKIVGTTVAALAVPLVLAVVGHIFSEGQKNRELAARYVELSISILNSTPSEHAAPLRAWAVDILAQHSPVPLSTEVRNRLGTDLPLGVNLANMQRQMNDLSSLQKQLSDTLDRLDDQVKNPIKPIRVP